MRRDHGRLRIPVGWNLYRVFAFWIVLVVLEASLGCARLFWEDKPLQTRLMSKVGKTQMSAVELRSRVNELAVRIPGIIEKAADAIRETSTDPQVRRRALVWKIDAVPAIQRVLLQSDPLAALWDGWVLGFQMLHYYAEEGGAALFGSSQSLAVQACRQSLAELEGVVNLVARTPDSIPQSRRNAEEWARQHPFEGNYFTRESVASDLERLVTGEAQRAFEGLDHVADTVVDLAARVNIYAEFLPRIARWHAELLADDVAGRDDVRRIQAEVETLRGTMERLAQIAGEMPGLLEAVEKRSVATLAAERQVLLLDIERQRLETVREAEVVGLRMVKQTVTELSGLLEGAEKRFLATLATERQVLLADFERQRLEALRDVEGIGLRMVNQTGNELDAAFDHLAWRLVQLVAGVLAVLLVLCLLGLLVARQFLLREAARIPRPPGGM